MGSLTTRERAACSREGREEGKHLRPLRDRWLELAYGDEVGRSGFPRSHLIMGTWQKFCDYKVIQIIRSEFPLSTLSMLA